MRWTSSCEPPRAGQAGRGERGGVDMMVLRETVTDLETSSNHNDD